MTQLRIGLSGWSYPGWRGAFYPEGLPHRRELEYASRRVNTVEINGSFYALQRPSSYAAWASQTPGDFVFAVKGSRYITHMKKLRDVHRPLANFFASGLLRLGPKLGPILWQFPPQLSFRPERFAPFLEVLPRTMADAARLAEEHDLPEANRAWTEPEHAGPLRHAFEVRHPSFFEPAFVELLRAHGAALVFADTGGRWPYAEELTADFVYVRLHGPRELYASGYADAELDVWAERLRCWQTGAEAPDAPRIVPAAMPPPAVARDVYVYFDNDIGAHAPSDALRLAERLRSSQP